MPDNFYTIEWLSRDRAREVERNLARQRLLASAARTSRPMVSAEWPHRVGEALYRMVNDLLRRAGQGGDAAARRPSGETPVPSKVAIRRSVPHRCEISLKDRHALDSL
jgi:hypothetical protein